MCAYLYFLAPTHSTLVQSRFSLFHALNSALYANEQALFALPAAAAALDAVVFVAKLCAKHIHSRRHVRVKLLAADNFVDFITPDLQVERMKMASLVRRKCFFLGQELFMQQMLTIFVLGRFALFASYFGIICDGSNFYGLFAHKKVTRFLNGKGQELLSSLRSFQIYLRLKFSTYHKNGTCCATMLFVASD